MLDLLVDFDALVTHSLGSAFTLSIWPFPIRRRSSLFVSFQNGINGAGATAPDLPKGAHPSHGQPWYELRADDHRIIATRNSGQVFAGRRDRI
jgi:hypothetical protein